MRRLLILQIFLIMPVFATEFPLKDICYDACIEISGQWLFKMDKNNTGITEKWYEKDFDRSSWEKILVPGVWNKKPGNVSYPVEEGTGWYFKKVRIPFAWKEKIFLVFLGSMYTTDIWIDGKYVGIHRGGYTPFFFDITEFLKPGTEIGIVVRVDNKRVKTIPSASMGWHPYGGIYREVYLIHRKNVYLDSIETSTTLNENQAVLNLKADVVNDSKSAFKGTIILQLKDRQKIAGLQRISVQVPSGTRKKAIFSLKINEPQLWCPENPFLYTVDISLSNGSKVEFPVGLRKFEKINGKLYLNGKRIWLQGFGNHEEYPGYGPCLNRDMIKSDLLLMKNVFKANSFRTGHYPFHPELFNMCDKLGFIVHTEIPAWQVDRVFMQSDEAWNLWLKPQIEEMIKTYRNHPCIAFWGLSNELYNVPEYHKKAAEFVRGLDPDRFITIVCAATSDLESNKIADIVARNFHYGWYHSKSVYALRDGLRTVVNASDGKPIWVAEIGGLAESGNYHGGYGDLSRGTETYQDKLLRFGIQYCSTQTDQICGISVWTLSDFHGKAQFIPHGILSESRKPKIGGYTVCNLFNGEVRLYICENDTMINQGAKFSASIICFNPGEKKFENLEANWCIMKNQKKLTSGRIRFNINGERQKEIEKIEFAVPEETGLYTLWVELFDSKGNWMYTNNCFFDAGKISNPGILKVKIPGNCENVKMLFQGIQIPVYPDIGLVLPFEQGKYELDFVAPGSRPVHKEVWIEQGKATQIEVESGKK